MPELLSLPKEILLQITEKVLPDDIENFSRICKSIHRLSGDALRVHAANKEKYRKLTLSALTILSESDEEDPMFASLYNLIDPLLMIRDVLQNDRVAFYPVEVVIKFSSPDEPDDEVSRVLAHYDGEIFSLLSGCPYLNSVEVKEWHNIIKDRKDVRASVYSFGASVAILLTILPNVEKITIYQYLFDDTSLRKMVDKISRATRNLSTEVRQLKALGKVIDLTLEGDVYTRLNPPAERRDLGLLGLFAALPSIQSIQGHRLDGRTFRPQQRVGDILVPYSRSLQEVHFTSSSISLDILSQLLSSIKTLQRFHYSHESYYYDEPKVELGEIVALLQRYARFSLVQLELTGFGGGVAVPPVSKFGNSLRTFKALERIRVDPQCLMKYQRNRRAGGRIPQIITRKLPASAKELELTNPTFGIKENEASIMFAELFDQKGKPTSNLQKIVFDGCMPFSETMRAELEAGGISLDARNALFGDL